MAEKFEKTSLWARTLATRRGRDPDHEAREILRRAYLDMRKGAKVLTEQIQKDCPELTVHNITHLDALWETADLIIGDSFDVNPSEAFVFGAAVLLHDAAMTLAAYPAGVADLVSTSEWQDAVAELADQYSRDHPNDLLLQNSPAELRGKVIFTVLRQLHARRAEELLDLKFARPGKDEALGLLSNIELKDSFGHSIGKIAHSHHWDIRDLSENLVTKVGAAAELPATWSVDEIKVACMLRCADAAHLDARRAPTFLYAVVRPAGLSALHWNFQNKLNQIVLEGAKIVFTSSPFSKTEADAWWLAYENASMVDREIRNSNALLEESGAETFHVVGVAAIESPGLFSKRVRVTGWEPVEAEVRVSDPVHLARTIGGENLYGGDRLAPLRELIQNSVDAIRARRSQDNLGPKWGSVNVTIDSSSDGKRWLHVEDNGIGMSQRVLTGPLIDFGNSFWSSALASEEFPGLRSKRVKTAGKFGIGFFSIFLLGEHVKVVSRRYDAGRKDALALEFAKLSKRPLIRPAEDGELTNDSNTRVSVELSELGILEPGKINDSSYGRPHYYPSLFERLRRMVVGLDVAIAVTVEGTKLWEHDADWVHTPADVFLTELFATEDHDDRERRIFEYRDRLRPVIENNGETVGRAALGLRGDQFDSAPVCVVSVDGFASTQQGGLHQRGLYNLVARGPSGVVGVLLGQTKDASRKYAEVQVSKQALARWATGQGEMLDRTKFTQTQLMQLAELIMGFGGDSLDLPCVFRGGNFETYRNLEDAIRGLNQLVFPLNQPYDGDLRLSSLKKATEFFMLKVHDYVVLMQDQEGPDRLLSEKETKELLNSKRQALTRDEVEGVIQRAFPLWFRNLLRSVWGENIEGQIAGFQMFSADLFSPPAIQWGLRLRRGAAPATSQ